MNPFIPRVRRSISPFALQPANVFGSLVARLAPVLFYRMGETTGTVANAANPGTDDATLTGTAVAGSGASAACGPSTHFTGEYLQTAASARINSLPELHAALLLNLAVLQDGHLLHKSGDFALELNSSGQVKFTVHFNGLNAVAMTAPIVPIDEWVWIEAYIGSDQIPHILVGGAETYYTVQTVGIGSRSASTAALNILSNATLDVWHQCTEVQDPSSCKTDLSWLKECMTYQQKKRGETAPGRA